MAMELTSYVNNNATSKLNTASPNNVVNVVDTSAVGDTTNVSVAIVPKGTGAFSLQVPDGTTAGGNVRGANAVDLQTDRGAANQVASGVGAVILGGLSNRSTGAQSIVGGFSSVGTTRCAVSLGYGSTVNGSDGVAVGQSNVAGINAVALGRLAICGSESYAIGWVLSAVGRGSFATGTRSAARLAGHRAHASGMFAAEGDAQRVAFVTRNKTTDATPTTLFLDGSSTRLTIPSGKILFADILISGIKSDGTAASIYKRKVAIKNVGGTTTLVGSVETIGTDHEDAGATDVAITADDTNNALQINVTGIAAETWRWVAVVEGLEIAYGT